jgi:glycosyltransferase involved in cell wall biosynthesis
MNSVLALIPSYNAASTVGDVMRTLKGFPELKEIIVVNDGSTDETGRIAEQTGATVLHHATNRGKGAALRTGFAHALGKSGWDALVTIDADLQHRPAELPAFLSARRDRRANIVVGHRARVGTGMPVHRIVSNMLTSVLVSARTGMLIKDSQCGYRLIGREVLESVGIESDGYEAETEFLLKSARHGFRIEFVPITTVYNHERSFMTHWETTKRFMKVLMKEY